MSARPAAAANADIDFTSPDFIADPYPTYQRLRAMEEPYWLPHTQTDSTSPGMWLFSRYDDVADILKLSAPLSKNISRVRPPGKSSPMDVMLLNQDPPDHTRLRNLVNYAFTPKRVKEFEPQLETMTDALISRMLDQSSLDLVTDFATPLPVAIISEILGVPDADREDFRRWSTDILTGHDSIVANDATLKRQKTAMTELVDYFRQLIEKRRRKPEEDIISVMVQAHDTHGSLSASELLAMCILFLVAGHETTTNLLGTGMLTLLTHPGQLALLRQHPELMPGAVEELLRYDGPVQRSTFRITTEACAIGGKRLAQGEQICAIIGAANRDAAQFDKPDTLDITRNPNRHLSFGLGIHFCLGTFLARSEARIGFSRLLERLPGIRLARDTQEWKTATMFRGLSSLPVVL